MLPNPKSLAIAFWTFLDSPYQSNVALRQIQGISVFLKYPLKGIAYTKGEMRWGIIIQTILTVYMLFLLLAKAPDYSVLNLVISWWLLLANLCAMVSKMIIFYHFVSLNSRLPIEELREGMKAIFAKRIYHYNVMFTGLCLLNYVCCMPLAIMIWKYEEKVPDLFVYSLIFVLRYFYSMYRYSKYFMKTYNPKNPYCFHEISFGNPDHMQAFPKLKERNECSICLKEYSEGCWLVEVPCGNHHYFHRDCMRLWIVGSLRCPLCRKEVISE